MVWFDGIYYQAMKKVKVRSVKLGLISLAAFGFVMVYVLGYQVFAKSRHFGLATPTGTARIQAQRPVKDHCNVNHPSCVADFTSRKHLPYCSQNPHKPNVKQVGQKKHPCEYWDEHQMNPIKFQGNIVMPTRITFQQQSPSGKCGINDPDEGCENIYTFDSYGNTTFMADVERFTLLIDHAFTMPREIVQTAGVLGNFLPKAPERGSTVDFPGYWERCEDPANLKGCELVRIPCLPGTKCDGTYKAGKFTKDTIPGTIGLSVGDVITVGGLLELAGVHLDDGVNVEGESWRESGVAIQIDVDYQNRQPFRFDFWNPGDLHYIYRVSQLPVESYKTPRARILPSGNRMLEDTHGIFISVRVQGSVAYFDATQMQLLLATCVSLLSIANMVVNSYAESLWRHSDKYKRSKYDATVDLNKDSICGLDVDKLIGEAGDQTRYDDHDQNHEFVTDFIGLDGEALRFAATVIHKAHRDGDDEHKDHVTKTYHEPLDNVFDKATASRAARPVPGPGYVSMSTGVVSPSDVS